MDEIKIQKKISLNTKIVIAIIIVLFALVAVLAFLNYRYMSALINSSEEEVIIITFNEQERHIHIEDIMTISQEQLIVNYRGTIRNFTGVSLAAIISYADFAGTADITGVALVSLDGFITAITADEAMDTQNTFIVFMEDGKRLLHMNDGGDGPFRLVIKNDPFPNRWARYLIEIRLQDQ